MRQQTFLDFLRVEGNYKENIKTNLFNAPTRSKMQSFPDILRLERYFW